MPDLPDRTPRFPAPGQAAPPGAAQHLPRGIDLPERGALPLSGLTILLVEDSRFTSDVLRLLCQKSGARMRRAETLERARAHLRTYRPDVVIVDLGLPDGRGEDLIREIAGGASVVIAASGDADGREAALRAGASCFMEKPLPGLAAFQRALLAQLPGRFVVPSVSSETAVADPMALRDDLRHAAALLEKEEGPENRRYLRGFLAGIALSSGDAGLARALAGVTEMGFGELRALVAARLEAIDAI